MSKNQVSDPGPSRPSCLSVIAQDTFLSHAVRCFNNGYVGKQPVAWKEYCVEYWLKKLQESMDRCTGHRSITEILFKMALNTKN